MWCDRYFWSTVVSWPPQSKLCRCWNYNHSYSLVILLCHIFLKHLFLNYQILWVFEFTDSGWNTDHANTFYKEKLSGNNYPLTINNFPRTLQIYDTDINTAFNLEKHGILCHTYLGSKLLLHKLITDNTGDNTGLLMWISNYCFSCIFQHNNMKTKAKVFSTVL